jgi:mycothiol synthase
MNEPPAKKFQLRPARLEDAQEVAALAFAVCSADGDPALALSAEDLLQYWQEPGYDIHTDTWIAVTGDGKIVGYEEIFNRHAFVSFEGDGYVLPGFEGQGIGSALLQAMEVRAREMMRAADPGLRVEVRNSMHIHDARARELHEHEGYAPVRYAWRMEINLDEPPVVPGLPDGIELRPFQAEKHARLLFEAVDEAFQDHWGYLPMNYDLWHNHNLEREGFDPSLWYVAWDANQVAGMSLCRYRQGIGWVNTLAVRRPWRKGGLGLGLLLHSFGEFHRRGDKIVGLGVDSENQTGATRLYKRAGMHVASEHVTYLKELRPGKSITEVE